MATKHIIVPPGLRYSPKGIPHRVDDVIYETKEEAQARVRELRTSGAEAHIRSIQPPYYGWSLIKDSALQGWYFVFIRENAKPSLPIKASAERHEPSSLTASASKLPDDLRQVLLGRLQSLSASEFERVVGEFLRKKGLDVWRDTGGPGDKGVDGIYEHPFLKMKVAVQVKKYATGKNIDGAAIREFRGAIQRREYDCGIFFTTSSFTEGAKEEIEGPGEKVIPIDGSQLVDTMVEMRLGVKQVITEGRIDEDFFKALGG